MSIDHYENFPVASILLPKQLRPAVAVIYAFARSADDLADEGSDTPEQRLAALKSYEDELDKIERRQPSDQPLFQSLSSVIEEYRLPLQAFRDLLSAFKQDVVTPRYACFADVLDYCRRSANPVGLLMLHLYGCADQKNIADSNAICSSLQLINFWQDVTIDWKKNRIYLPQEDLVRFGISEDDIAHGCDSAAWRSLMRFEVERARAMMLSGAPLALRLPGRIGWELRLVTQGGLRILEKIEAAGYDVFRKRPVLGKADWLRLIWRSIGMRA